MNSLKKLITCLFLAVAVAGLPGCNEGPMERAGKEVDEVIEDTGEALEDAGEAIEDAVEDQRQKSEG